MKNYHFPSDFEFDFDFPSDFPSDFEFDFPSDLKLKLVVEVVLVPLLLFAWVVKWNLVDQQQQFQLPPWFWLLVGFGHCSFLSSWKKAVGVRVKSPRSFDIMCTFCIISRSFYRVLKSILYGISVSINFLNAHVGDVFNLNSSKIVCDSFGNSQ